jgi:transposase
VDEALKDKMLASGTPIEIWFQDEARIGQKNGLAYQWARKGTRPRQPKDQRYDNAYLFGAICPARDTGAAVVMPYADTHAMQIHLDEISRRVAEGAHAVLLLDQAGWHTTKKLRTPANITMLPLPPKSPELNPTENIWQYLRQTWLSNRVFGDYNEICDACCVAWNKLIAEGGRIASIGTRDWAITGQDQ